MAGANADDVVAQMLTQYEQEVKQLNYTYPHDAGLSDYEVLILASIIECEAAADNKKAVASVFYNRLAIDMALQSDATTAYVIGGDPKPEDLQKEGPFNTYLNKGLPPGPSAHRALQRSRQPAILTRPTTSISISKTMVKVDWIISSARPMKSISRRSLHRATLI